MAIHTASVKKAAQPEATYPKLTTQEHCSADSDVLQAVGCTVGHQVRIIRNASEYALYTVKEEHQENPNDTVVVREDSGEGKNTVHGLKRLGTTQEFTGTIDSQVPHSTFTTEEEANLNSEFIEQLTDNGVNRGLIVIAPHGGDIEPFTSEQAEHVAYKLRDKVISTWQCKGYKQGGGAWHRWHITSTDIHEASLPKLSSQPGWPFSNIRASSSVISRGFRYAVAFHGFTCEEIRIGGLAPDTLKGEIKREIEQAMATAHASAPRGTPPPVPVVIAGVDPSTCPERYNGQSERNIVNRLTDGGRNGIQIEQSMTARRTYHKEIAEAVAKAYDSKLADYEGCQGGGHPFYLLCRYILIRGLRWTRAYGLFR